MERSEAIAQQLRVKYGSYDSVTFFSGPLGADDVPAAPHYFKPLIRYD
jgi:hypothetical protein